MQGRLRITGQSCQCNLRLILRLQAVQREALLTENLVYFDMDGVLADFDLAYDQLKSGDARLPVRSTGKKLRSTHSSLRICL
jgi:hypothetical protein